MAEKKIVGLSIVLIDAEKVSGLKLIWAQGFGLADKEAGVPGDLYNGFFIISPPW
jgi:hypothetical protein